MVCDSKFNNKKFHGYTRAIQTREQVINLKHLIQNKMFMLGKYSNMILLYDDIEFTEFILVNSKEN